MREFVPFLLLVACGGELAEPERRAPAATEPEAPVVAPCEVPAPYGNQIGESIPDLALPDCDGNLHRFHDQCEKPTVWIFALEGW
jgi:hypothetical protein